ncbi:unnamed protein product, partial [Didymodactylos carnosus]
TTLSNGTFNTTCTSNTNCNEALLLQCINGLCECPGVTATNDTWFWNGTYCVVCPALWLNYELYCYYLSQTSATWSNGRTWCLSNGADLLVIKTKDEWNFIQPYAASIIGSYVHDLLLKGGVFSWVDSTMLTFTCTNNNDIDNDGP